MAAIECSNPIEGSTEELRCAGAPVSGAGGTHPGATTGQLLKDTVNGIEYQNQGVPGNPTWDKVGSES